MKNLFTLIAFICCAHYSQSQNVEWAITGGGALNDRILSFVTDPSSSSYILIRVDSGIIRGARIEKHDSYGNLSWTVTIDPGVSVYKLLMSYQNELCLVASADSNINFAGTNLSSGMFCARLDLNGNWTQVKNASLFPPYYDMFGDFAYNDFSIDSLGGLYASATKTTHPFQPEESLLLKSWHMGYFEMLDSSLTSLSYSAESGPKSYGFQADALKNGGAIYSTTEEISNHYTFKLAKVDEHFDTIWIAQPTSGTYGGLSNVILDQDDQVYIEGAFVDTFSINAFTIIDTSLNSKIYLARLDGNGQVASGFEISSPYIWNGSLKISRILNNRIYLSCIFAESLNISGNMLMIPDTNWVFLCMDLNGNVLWDYYHEFSYFNNEYSDAAVDDNENIFMYGGFQNNFFYNGNPSNGMQDWYILKMPNTNVGVEEVKTQPGDITIVPNPSSGLATLFISETAAKQPEVSVYDVFGNQVINFKSVSPRTELDFRNFAAGLYIVNIRGENFFKSMVFNKMR